MKIEKGPSWGIKFHNLSVARTLPIAGTAVLDIKHLHQTISLYLKTLFGQCLSFLDKSPARKDLLNLSLTSALQALESNPEEVMGPNMSQQTMTSCAVIDKACAKGTAKNMSLYLYKDSKVLMRRTPQHRDTNLPIYRRGVSLTTDPRVLQRLLFPAKGCRNGQSQLLLLSSERGSLDPWVSHGFLLRENISLIIAVRADR